MYSNYKSRTTGKIFVAVTPAGFASFISDVHEGSISDRAIVEKSGFLDIIDPGDIILADRGFTIDDLLCRKGARLIIPPFMEKRDALSLEDEIRTSQIAKARIHIERWNKRLKNFRFVQRPIHNTKMCLLTPAVFVCGIFANYTSVLAK